MKILEVFKFQNFWRLWQNSYFLSQSWYHSIFITNNSKDPWGCKDMERCHCHMRTYACEFMIAQNSKHSNFRSRVSEIRDGQFFEMARIWRAVEFEADMIFRARNWIFQNYMHMSSCGNDFLRCRLELFQGRRSRFKKPVEGFITYFRKKITGKYCE